MAKPVDLAPVRAFLACETPAAWCEAAVEDLPTLLNDHANCEKKAASTALALMFRYDRDGALAEAMSRIAREELRHFEQVTALMRGLKIAHAPVSASRYAQGLRERVRPQEPQRLLDLLICGAFVEARSCERFAALLPYLPRAVAPFYARLLASEARHFETYLHLARGRYDEGEVEARCQAFQAAEEALVIEADETLRFHSGPPPGPRAPSP
ncbi:MAG: tRNA-(ms[2]io[6]A)-hydroxylase [Pseudomonadales bacterium]|nr:tRNA-(ms[2]io[6]A)-hydroxylase [Pseudomonadales bacterium]MBL6808786.1 tRNA-(ms[2]io[6]A)-hydroxylase [Pseudomonadales bacterium]